MSCDDSEWYSSFRNLFKQHPGKKLSHVMKRLMAGWNQTFLAAIFFGATT
jgi:hypothetical protein